MLLMSSGPLSHLERTYDTRRNGFRQLYFERHQRSFSGQHECEQKRTLMRQTTINCRHGTGVAFGFAGLAGAEPLSNG